MRSLATLVTLCALVATAAACDQAGTYGPCNLELEEINGADVILSLLQAERECFKMVPSNDGFFFHLGDSTYGEGVEFKHCDQPGGCTCQSFGPCHMAASGDQCSCFKPYACADTEGLYRCFRPKSCNARTLLTEVEFTFNQPIMFEDDPLVGTCQDTFVRELLQSLGQCVPMCKFGDESEAVLSADGTTMTIPVRGDADLAAIQECVDTQYVGAFEYFVLFASGTGDASSSTSAVSSAGASSTAVVSSTGASSAEPSTEEVSTVGPSSTMIDESTVTSTAFDASSDIPSSAASSTFASSVPL
eukprot:m.297126 g.297126  ORF g.297126 m.297126 type:complete len:303 (-) comp15858_c6_seq17:5608-6516(-)